jgi:hypothetical protein
MDAVACLAPCGVAAGEFSTSEFSGRTTRLPLLIFSGGKATVWSSGSYGTGSQGSLATPATEQSAVFTQLPSFSQEMGNWRLVAGGDAALPVGAVLALHNNTDPRPALTLTDLDTPSGFVHMTPIARVAHDLLTNLSPHQMDHPLSLLENATPLSSVS